MCTGTVLPIWLSHEDAAKIVPAAARWVKVTFIPPTVRAAPPEGNTRPWCSWPACVTLGAMNVPVVTGDGRCVALDTEDYPRLVLLPEACGDIDPRLWELMVDQPCRVPAAEVRP